MVGHHPRPELQLLAAKHQLQHEHPAQLLRVPGTGHRESGRPDVAPSLLLQRVFVEPRFQSEVGLDQKPSLLVQLRHPCGNRRAERSGQQGSLCRPVPSMERFRMAQHQRIRNSARLPTGLHGLVQSTARKNTVLLVDFPRRQLHGQLFLGTRHGTGRRNFLRQYHQQPAFGYDKRTLQPGNAVQFLFFPERGQQEILGQRTEESQGQKQP